MPVPSLASNYQKPAGLPVHAEDAKQVKLFQPYQCKSVKMHNRLGVSPMCMYSAADGILNDFHIAHYGSLALKGPGLVMVEASAVVPEGRITPQDSGLWNDDQMRALQRVVEVIKSQGSVPGVQIGHAGRKASTSPPFKGDYVEEESNGGWPNNCMAPSAIPFASHYPKPREMTREQIQDTIQAFADAAIRADKAGVEVLEIHAAHGYLISTFYSASSNQRTDKYGGSFENRIRLLLEIVQSVKKVWPDDKPLWVRLSCSDYTNPDPMGESPEGWDIYQSVELAKKLKSLGVDLIDCSSGGIIKGVRYPTEKMYQVQFAAKIKRDAGIDTAAVGLIVEGRDAEDILQKNEADYILAGREFLRNSAFVLVAAQALNVEITWPQQYSWAVKKARRQDVK
ncbi:hypothetical protein BDF20DRAFT_905861 [Mycotypha africana]|uniref:uncharacterized protein n=1 Tax=Mycotypha africana TaxID=64632 RepID=UPI0023009329|nr:uncharacterized protein BDF20DRAFT_905861 [Mycotypha africana]KAI8982404.1 hypothetical protein BDF20DRAFT_905861 [Mycotypha africana]